jgi:protocatechuate 3,4-dioxygenase beta subunit
MTNHADQDRQRSISRRAALGLLRAVSLGSLAAACSRKLSGARSSPSASAAASSSPTAAGTASPGATAPSCVLTQEVTEGPYYLPLHLVRSDITEGSAGVPLQLDLTVVDATTCQPLSGALVDIWHADANGTYSGVAGASGTFLRGVQSTSSDGVASFTTIYPGWYMGRAVHIHLKVILNDLTLHTGQLFFDDALTSSVYQANAPYSSRPVADTPNTSDSIFQQAGGSGAILDMKQRADGYLGAITMGVNT